MPQFDVYANPNPVTRLRVPYLLDIQSSLLESLSTRVVIPLCKPSLLKGKLAKGLNPVLVVEGREMVMLTPELAGISRKALGARVANLAACRAEIVGALDLVISGI